jgi:hypothetical protein
MRKLLQDIPLFYARYMQLDVRAVVADCNNVRSRIEQQKYLLSNATQFPTPPTCTRTSTQHSSGVGQVDEIQKA